jgi:hypothetical protein
LTPLPRLKEFIRHPSISADSRYQEGMAGARDFVAGLRTIGELG